MRCHVYKSRRRADTYVYLGQRDGFDALPPALRESLVPLEWVLDVELDGQRRLAREDATIVAANVTANGFHLQLPPPRLIEFGAQLARD